MYRIGYSILANIEVFAEDDFGRRLVFKIGHEVCRIMGRSRLAKILSERVINSSPGEVFWRSVGRWKICEDSLQDWLVGA